MTIFLRYVVGISIFCGLLGCSGVIDLPSLSPQPMAAESLVVSPASPSNDTTPTVSGNTTASASVKLFSATNCTGLVLGSTTASTSGSFSITSSTLSEGTYNFSVLATTAGGSTCSANSVAYLIDVTPPVYTISAPSQTLVNSSSTATTYSLSYISTSTVSLTAAGVSLVKTGTANCTIAVTGGTTYSPLVSLTACTGNGTIGILIATGSAVDATGNQSIAASSKLNFTVDNSGVSSGVYSPTNGIYDSVPSTATLTFVETIDGTSVTAADFTVSGSCGTLPVLAVTSVVGSVVNFTLSGATCSAGQTAVVTANLTGIKDPVGNSGSGTSTVTYTIDNIGPNSAIFNPASMRISAIPATLTVTFNEAVNASTVSNSDFTISGTCTTLPTLNVTTVSGTIASLSLSGAVCSTDETVILSVNLATINDVIGNAGSGTSSVTYTFDNIGPVTATISPVTAALSVIPASVVVNFTELLLATSVVDTDLIVSGTCATLPTATLSSVSAATANFSLSGGSCNMGQTVIVTMNGADVTDDPGNNGTGSVSATYTFDNVGPIATSSSPVTGTVNAIPTSITISFSEAVLASSVSSLDLVATGTCATLPSLSLSSVSGSLAVFNLAGAVCASGETTVLTLNGSDVTDAAANSGSGTVVTTFTIDNVGPSPSSMLPVSSNLTTMPASVTINFDESVLASSVTGADLGISGSCSVLPTASVASVSGAVVTFALTAATCAESQTLILTSLGSSVTDLLGNAGSNNQVVTYRKDTTGPSAISFSPSTGAVISIPTTMIINFDEALLAGSIAAADFTVSGTCTILPVHSVSGVSGQQVFISLSGAVCSNGQTAIITVNGAGINDVAGNPGSGTPAVSFTVDNVGPTVSGFSPNSGAPPANLSVTFNENLNPATLSLADFTIGGTCSGQVLSLNGITNNVVDLSISGPACASGEDVTLSIDASTVADVVGNAGSGTSFVTYTQP